LYKRKFKRWYLTFVKKVERGGRTITAPLMCETDHRGSYRVLYNPDTTLALILYAVDDERLYEKMEEEMRAHPLPPTAEKGLEWLRRSSNPIIDEGKLDRVKQSRFERLTPEETDSIGKLFFPDFNRKVWEEARPLE